MNRRSPRAARLARNEMPVETEALASESAPASPADDREALLRELDRIIQSDGPDPAKVSALSLKAKLLGLSDPAPADPEGDDAIVRDATPRDMARAVLATVREYSAQLKDLLGIELVVKYPNESIFRTSDPDIAKLHGGEPALTLEEHLVRGSSIAEREPVYSADGSEIRVGDYTIQFTDCAGQGLSRPRAEWVVTDAAGAVLGRRLTSEDAIAVAKALPRN